MRVNVFRIPEAELQSLTQKLKASQMEIIKTVQQGDWTGTFYYFSTSPALTLITWAKTYE